MNENSRTVDPVIQEKFYLCMHSLKAFPDLTYEVLQQPNGKMFLVISKQRDCVTYSCDGVDIVIKPARIVVDESGKGSLQVLYQCVETVNSPSGLFDLMKKVSSVGGYCLCSGLGEAEVDDPSQLNDVNSNYPFPRAESVGCLKWFQPKRRTFNAPLARCPECTKWVKTKRCRVSMQLKRSGANNSNEPSTSQKNNETAVVSQETSLNSSLIKNQVNMRKPLCSLSVDDLRTRCRALQSTIYKQRRSLKRLKSQLAKSRSTLLDDEDEDDDKIELCEVEADEIILCDSPPLLLQETSNQSKKDDLVELELS